MCIQFRCLYVPHYAVKVIMCRDGNTHLFAGQYESDTPTGFTDEDDDAHRKGFTKPGPVTAELLAAEKIAKPNCVLQLQQRQHCHRSANAG